LRQLAREYPRLDDLSPALVGSSHPVLAVPDRDAMTPPKLARDRPVVGILEPVVVNALEPFRHELQRAVLRGVVRWLGELLHSHEPLLADHRLDDRVAAVTMPDAVRMRLDLHQQVVVLEPLHHALPGILA